VRDAVVIAREDVAGDKRLVAYVTTDANTTELSGTLRAHLATHQRPESSWPLVFSSATRWPKKPAPFEIGRREVADRFREAGSATRRIVG
jgi:hypothetical protein